MLKSQKTTKLNQFNGLLSWENCPDIYRDNPIPKLTTMRVILRFIFASIILLHIQQKGFAQGGDNAAAAAGAPITLPFASSGTTCGHVNDYNPFTPYAITTSGSDWLYYFCAPTNGTIDVMLNNTYGYAPGAFIYSVTPTGGNWFATSFTGGLLSNSIVSFTATAGTCYYIMIDNDKFDDGFTCFPYNINIQYHTPPPASPLQPACTNIGYDAGNFGGWSATTGAVSISGAGAPTPSYSPQFYTTSATQQVITTGGVDPYGAFPQVNPSGGTNSMRLGDYGVFGTTNQYGPSGIPGAGGATIEQKFTVTASNALFVYYYAVVIQDAGSNHTSQEQPFFKTDIYDCTGNPVACGQYLVTGGPGIPGFSLAAGTTDVYYKNWSPVAVDLTPFIGTCVTVRYTVGDCTRGAHFAYAYVDATCNPLAITGINKVCPTKSTVLTAPVGLFTYSWTPGGLTTQSVAVTPTATTTYTCELTSFTNCKTFLTYSVSLYPSAIVSSNASTVCAGTAAALTTTVNNGAGSYTWTPSGGNSSSASVSPAASTIFTVTYSDVNGCQDTALSRVTVNPIPTMLTPTNVTVCHNVAIAASVFSSTLAGTTFSWTNTTTSIGLVANGSGNTPGFTALNIGASPVSAIVSVTPTANSCVGPPVVYTITVNPIPNVNPVPSATYCSGSAVAATAFSGSVTATTYSWTNTNTTIGLGASGAGNTTAFTAANVGSGPISGVITVTPTANTCVGIPINYTVLVNPIPTVNAVPSATYCSSIAVAATTFTGSVLNTTYNWTNSNTTIGLATASGINTVAAFTSSNLTSAPISGVITVTPTANTCTGTPTSYTILVNPIPNVVVIPSATYCTGVAVAATAFTGSVTGTTFNWINTNTTIGLGASGVGNTPAFTSSNLTSAPISGVITVTPSANSCVGTPTNYTVLVNPIPTVNAVPSATYCNGVAVPATVFTGSVTGTTFNWVNTNTTIGLGASGVGNTPAFNATNNTLAPLSGVITVTPSANSCVGTPTNYTVLVNPTPSVLVPPNAVYCGGAIVPISTFTSNLAGVNLSWTNSNPPIGLASAGLGNPPSFTSSNTTASPLIGVISVTPTANSCVGTPASFSITVNPPIVAPTVANATVCPGSSATLTATAPGGTYTWYDAAVAGNLLITNPAYTTPNLTVTTTYYVNTTNASGCISPLTPVSVTVLNFLTVSAAPNKTICIGATASLSVTPNGVGYLYSWDSPTAPAFSAIFNPTVNPVATTVYSVTVTSANGCTGTGTTQVVVNPLPISNPGNPIAFCSGQSGSLGSATQVGYTYTWTPTTGLSNSNLSSPTVSLTNLGTTPSLNNYTLNVSLNGCQASNSVQVTVNPIPVSNAGAPITLCAGQTGVIGTATNAGYTYSWLPATNLNSSTLSNPTVTGVNGGSTNTSVVYTVTTADALTACQSNANVTVTILPLPTVNVGAVPTVCSGVASVPLNGTVGGSANSGIWSGGSGSFNPNSTTLGASYSPTAAEFLAGSVTLTLTAIATAPCLNVNAPVVINFYANPVPNFTVDVPKGCPIHCVNFTDLSTILAPDVIQGWSWNFGDGGTSNVQNPPHCYNQTGIYSVTLTVITNHLCSASLVIPAMIEVYAKPIASFIPNPSVSTILDPLVYFQNTSQGATSYNWGFGDGYATGTLNSSTLVNPNHTYSVSGEYEVTLIATSIHGCVDITKMTIEIQPEFAFFIPNAFTPTTTDGHNDFFTGFGVGIEQFELWIFDRWGVNIYYTNDMQKGWDGTVQGTSNPVQQDVYVWKVKIKDVFKRPHNYVGHVTVLR